MFQTSFVRADDVALPIVHGYHGDRIETLHYCCHSTAIAIYRSSAPRHQSDVRTDKDARMPPVSLSAADAADARLQLYFRINTRCPSSMTAATPPSQLSTIDRAVHLTASGQRQPCPARIDNSVPNRTLKSRRIQRTKTTRRNNGTGVTSRSA